MKPTAYDRPIRSEDFTEPGASRNRIRLAEAPAGTDDYPKSVETLEAAKEIRFRKQHPSLRANFYRRVAERNGTLLDTYDKRLARGVDPEIAARPERTNAADPEETHAREVRAQWRKRHPEQSPHLGDDEVDAIIQANRNERRGGDRRSAKRKNK